MTSSNGRNKSASEEEFLAQQSEQARAAIERTIADVEDRVRRWWRGGMREGRAWIPLGIAAFIGFCTGILLAPRGNRRPERRAAQPAPEAPAGEPQRDEPAQKAWRDIVGPPLAAAVARVVETALAGLVAKAVSRPHATGQTTTPADEGCDS